VPIIADEIYGDLTYDGAKFYPMATLEPKVPLISCDGIAKRYLVPGWRLGWVTVHDRHGVLIQVISIQTDIRTYIDIMSLIYST
jgi:tyrosine aminotransferase